MRRLLVLIGTIAVSAPLWAQVGGIGTASLSWTNPTTYDDGSALNGLAFIYVERSVNSVVGPFTRVASLGPLFLDAQSYLDNGLFDSSYTYRVTAEDSLYHGVSEPSNYATKVIAIGGSNSPPLPAAPANLIVQ